MTCGARSSRNRTSRWAWWWLPCPWAFASSSLLLSTSLVSDDAPPVAPPRPLEVALLGGVFVVAACGLVYELAAGALASYVLGDLVLQFSTVIGSYLFAMGVGSWLSRFFERQLPAHFLRIELLVALVGGAMPALLFLAHAWVPGAFRLVLYL